MRNSEMNRAHGWLTHFCSLCTLLISMLSYIQTKWYQLSAIYDGPPLSRKEWRECLPAIDLNSLCTAGWRDNKILLPHQSAIISHNSLSTGLSLLGQLMNQIRNRGDFIDFPRIGSAEKQSIIHISFSRTNQRHGDAVWCSGRIACFQTMETAIRRNTPLSLLF